MALRLELTPEIGPSVEVPPGARLVVGRVPGCGLTIVDSDISREHAALTSDGAAVFVEDLGSKNGVFVNDRRIEARTRLAPGDRVRFGPRADARLVDTSAPTDGPGATPSQDDEVASDSKSDSSSDSAAESAVEPAVDAAGAPSVPVSEVLQPAVFAFALLAFTLLAGFLDSAVQSEERRLATTAHAASRADGDDVAMEGPSSEDVAKALARLGGGSGAGVRDAGPEPESDPGPIAARARPPRDEENPRPDSTPAPHSGATPTGRERGTASAAPPPGGPRGSEGPAAGGSTPEAGPAVAEIPPPPAPGGGRPAAGAGDADIDALLASARADPKVRDELRKSPIVVLRVDAGLGPERSARVESAVRARLVQGAKATFASSDRLAALRDPALKLKVRVLDLRLTFAQDYARGLGRTIEKTRLPPHPKSVKVELVDMGGESPRLLETLTAGTPTIKVEGDGLSERQVWDATLEALDLVIARWDGKL